MLTVSVTIQGAWILPELGRGTVVKLEDRRFVLR
jgi:hypothetical protein